VGVGNTKHGEQDGGCGEFDPGKPPQAGSAIHAGQFCEGLDGLNFGRFAYNGLEDPAEFLWEALEHVAQFIQQALRHRACGFGVEDVSNLSWVVVVPGEDGRPRERTRT